MILCEALIEAIFLQGEEVRYLRQIPISDSNKTSA